MTSHERFQEELPAYIAGRLEDTERRLFEAHLQSCEDCRGIAATWRELAPAMREAGEALFEPHPAEDELRAFAHARRSAADPRVSGHLASCASCELEVAAMRRGPRRLPARSGSRSSLILVAAVAGLILGVGLSFVLWRPRSDREGAAGPGRPVQHLVLPSSPLRGEKAVAQYRLVGGDEPIELDFQPGPPEPGGEDGLYRFEICGEGGTLLWSSEMTGARVRETLGSDQVIGFILPAGILRPGRYEIRLVSPRAGGEPSVHRIAVEILAAP